MVIVFGFYVVQSYFIGVDVCKQPDV